MSVKIKKGIIQDSNIILKFLQKTKDGKFAVIETSSIPYSRIKEVRSELETCDEQYQYSMT